MNKKENVKEIDEEKYLDKFKKKLNKALNKPLVKKKGKKSKGARVSVQAGINTLLRLPWKEVDKNAKIEILWFKEKKKFCYWQI